MRVGIDFDNTIITYDDVFRAIAPSFVKIDSNVIQQKRQIRDYLRTLSDGELTWQRLQGHVYGKGISGAKLYDGVGRFLHRCRSEGCEVLIISHKTQFGHHDSHRVNLRDAALGWMRAQGFFRDDGYAIPMHSVFFESTRAEKIARIGELGCTYFVDDLEEVLDDPQFPTGVEGILFSPDERRNSAPRYPVCRSWAEIEELLFHA
jgi:hypothetical protein